MPQKGLSMRKIREVLRLHHLGLLQHEIARSCSISQTSVNRYLQRASAAGLSWPLPEDHDDRRLDELLFFSGTGWWYSPGTSNAHRLRRAAPPTAKQ